MSQPRLRRGPREVVASFATRAEAREALSHLVDLKLPSDELWIVPGRMGFMQPLSPERAERSTRVDVWSGACIGALAGGAIGALLGPALWAALAAASGAPIGVALGGLVARRPARRASHPYGVHAASYDLLADVALAARARAALATAP